MKFSTLFSKGNSHLYLHPNFISGFTTQFTSAFRGKVSKAWLLMILTIAGFAATSQTVTITGTPQLTSNVSPGFRNRVLYLFKVQVAGSAATLTAINGITTSGNYLTSDITASTTATPNRGFRLHHVNTIGTINGDPNLPATNQFVNNLENTTGGTVHLTVNGVSTGSGQTISANFAAPVSLAPGTHFFYLTVDIAPAATIGRTVGINAFNQSAFVFSGTPTVNAVSFPASGLQTFKNATLTITGVAPAAATVERGIGHLPLYRFDITTSGAATQIGDGNGSTQMVFSLDGSAIAATGTTSTTDFNRFRVVYSRDQVIDATDQVISGGTDAIDKTVSAPNLPLSIPEGVTRSIYLTTNTQATGSIGATVQVTNINLNAPSGTTVVRGSIPVGGLQTLGSNVAKVSLIGTRLPADPLLQGTVNNPLGFVQVSVTDATTQMTRLTVQTSGPFLGTDYTAFKLWVSNSATFDSSNAVLLNTWTSGAFNGALFGFDFPGLSPIQGATPTAKHYPIFTAGTTAYYHLTVDVAPSATVGNFFGMGFNATASDANNTRIPGVRTVVNAPGSNRPIAAYAQITTTSLINSALNLPRGANNQVLYKFKTAVSNTSATLSNVSLNVNATNFNDIDGGYKLYYSSASNLNLANATQIGTTVAATANNQTLTFTPAAPFIFAAGQEIFFYLVANTNAAATLGNTIVVAAPGASNFSFSDGVKTYNTTATTHTISGPPQITVSATALPAENIAVGTKNVMLYQLPVEAAVANADFTGITFQTAGSASNISYRLYYSSDSLFDKADVQIGNTVSASGANQDLIFNAPVPIRLELNSKATLFLIADIGANTQPGTIVSIAAPVNTNVRFILGDVLGMPTAGALKSIVAPPVVTVNSAAPTVNALAAGFRNFVVYKAAISVDTTAYVNLLGISLQTRNSFQPTDISGGFRFYLSADTLLDASDKLLGTAGMFITPQQIILNLPNAVRLAAGLRTNLLVTTDLSQYAKVGSQVQLEALSLSKLKFESSSNTGTTQAGNIAIISPALPMSFPYNVLTNAALVPGCTSHPAEAGRTGIVDVTQPPYNADKTGVQDATAAFRAALANSATFVYVPNGTYRFTDSVEFAATPARHPVTGVIGTGGENIQMWGESREGVILKLDPNSPAFSDPNNPRAFFKTGTGSPDRFNNTIWNVTFEVGTGNPGAIGLRHFLHNLGGLYNVTIRTLGAGKIGLDKGYNRANGPSLTKDVLIEGFEIGLKTDFSVESEVYEHITLKNQTQAGWVNGKQILSIRDLKVVNCAGPAFVNQSGFVNLLDADLQGAGAAAFVNGTKGKLLVRNLKSSGYTQAISDPETPTDATSVMEYLSDPVTGRNGQPTTAATLNLPVKETPVIPWDAPSDWVNVGDFGASANGVCNGTGTGCLTCDDDAPAIQRAIDATLPGGSRAGATTLFLPGSYRIRNNSIRLRGTIRRVISPNRSTGGSSSGFADGGTSGPLTAINWIIEAGTHPEVEFNNIGGGGGSPLGYIKNESGRTLIFKNCGIPSLTQTGGEIFFESCSMGYMEFTNVDVWARQIDPEANRLKIDMNGGTYWGLGLKTEQGAGIMSAKNAKVEQFGGYIYSTHDSRTATMYRFENSEVSLSMFEYLGYYGNPFLTLVEDIQAGNKATLTRGPDDAPTYPATWSQNNDSTTDRRNGIVGSMFLLYRNTNTLNNAPTFTLSQDSVNVIESTGTTDSIANFAQAIDDGNHESKQVLNFELTTDNDALFSKLPSIDPGSGTLTYALKENASGKATVSVVLKDNGSAVAPNENTSEVRTFVITVAALPVPVVSASGSLTFCPGGSVVLTSTEAIAYQWFKNGTLLNGETTRNLPASLTGEYTVRATYANGVMKTSQPASIYADDAVKPQVLTKNISVTLVNGSAVIAPADVDNGTTDNCGIASLELSKTTFSCAEIGNHTVTLKATDNSGNSSSATATIQVVGSIPTPSVSVSRTDNTYTGLDANTIALGYGAQSLMLSATNSSSASNTYAWSPATGLSNATSASPVFTPTAAGLYVFTLSVTNAFGCQAQTTVVVKVKDVRCGKKNDKVIVCRRAGTSKAEGRCISVADVAEHLRKGGKLGNCEGAGNENPEREPVEPTRRVKLTAYPNPFAKRTTVSFTVSKAERNVTLAIFDALGNRITTLYSGSVEAGATKALVFDRAQLPAGLYFARLLTATGSKTIKLISSK